MATVDEDRESDEPPSVAYRLFRRGIERHTKTRINNWTFLNFAVLELQNSIVATMIGLNKSNITKWMNKTQPVPLDNVAPLAYAFAASIPLSERWNSARFI